MPGNWAQQRVVGTLLTRGDGESTLRMTPSLIPKRQALNLDPRGQRPWAI